MEFPEVMAVWRGTVVERAAHQLQEMVGLANYCEDSLTHPNWQLRQQLLLQVEGETMGVAEVLGNLYHP